MINCKLLLIFLMSELCSSKIIKKWRQIATDSTVKYKATKMSGCLSEHFDFKISSDLVSSAENVFCVQ